MNPPVVLRGFDAVQSLDAWNIRASAGVDENAFAVESDVADTDAMGTGEPGVAAKDVQVRALADRWRSETFRGPAVCHAGRIKPAS